MAKEKKSPPGEAIIDDPSNITFDYNGLSNNLNEVLTDIRRRLEQTDVKLTAIKGKEEILNKIIVNTETLLNKTPQENYKQIGVYQRMIMDQLESFNMIQESLMRYEDLAQRYIKMKMDIENNKLASFVKVKALYKTNDTADEGFDQLLKSMHSLTQNPTQVLDIQAEAEKQLKIAGY